MKISINIFVSIYFFNTTKLANGDGSTRLRSVATLILNSRTAASDDRVLAYVTNAEAIFFAGGDQSRFLLPPPPPHMFISEPFLLARGRHASSLHVF
jgi:hypothetical protein